MWEDCRILTVWNELPDWEFFDDAFMGLKLKKRQNLAVLEVQNSLQVQNGLKVRVLTTEDKNYKEIVKNSRICLNF